eukprot:scaffold79019_cov18-Tisochrysis_lutea.AAC.3
MPPPGPPPAGPKPGIRGDGPPPRPSMVNKFKFAGRPAGMPCGASGMLPAGPKEPEPGSPPADPMAIPPKLPPPNDDAAAMAAAAGFAVRPPAVGPPLAPPIGPMPPLGNSAAACC